MANEATKRYDESSGDGTVIQDYTVADGTGISKGALLKLTDPRTAVLSDGDNDVLAGIAARDKVADDGRTQLSVYKKGYFDLTCSGSVTIGKPVISHAGTAGSNIITQGDSSDVGSEVLGYAEETGSDGEKILVRVDL